MSYVAALPLSSPDAQLLAVIISIRAARGGTGNITGQDLQSLKLTNQVQTVDALRELGWEIPAQLLNGPPETPVAVTVPALTVEKGHPLPFGRQVRTRVSGWTTRTLAAKPLKKTTPAVRLAGLFLAAHSSPTLHGTLPKDFPAAFRAVLPNLLATGFLTELTGDQYRLAASVRHLAGRLTDPTDTSKIVPTLPRQPRWVPPQFSADDWAQWKDAASPALRQHAEAVECCALCALPPADVASAFMAGAVAVPSARHLLAPYNAWKAKRPDHGLRAAPFTVAFRTEHGHGPSYGQLCAGLRWGMFRTLRTLVVGRLLTDGWLTETAHVPWTLRPGPTADTHGISLAHHTAD